MFRAVLILAACCSPLAASAQHALTGAEYVHAMSLLAGADHTVRQQSLKTLKGELLVGVLLPTLATETLESKAILYVAQLRTDGIVQESVKSEPFPFYTAGGKYYIEDIQLTSSDRFSIQFNQRAEACGGGYEIYRFALLAGVWRVSGRDMSRFQCRGSAEGVEDSRTEWSANYRTGRVIVREFRHHRLVSTKRQQRNFPVFLLRSFHTTDSRYGPR